MKGMSIAGLVLGIVSLVLCWIAGIGSIIAWPMAIAALILGAIGGKKLKAAGQPAGVATAALVIGIIATVLTTITFFTCGICVLCVADGVNDLANAVK